MENMVNDLESLKGRRVLVTGHSGFKGKWLCALLLEHGALITGISKKDEFTEEFLEQFSDPNIINHWVNIIDFSKISEIVQETQPEFCFHMAAQPLVNYSYKNPVETYESNVIGTQSLLEAFRINAKTKSTIVVITTDKVYKDLKQDKPYTETNSLGGKDPYSSSKACVELLLKSYRESYFNDNSTHNLVAARAGNVIGPFDFTKGRIVPDFFLADDKLTLRFPEAVRPWQHVLEPLFGYIKFALFVSKNTLYPRELNFGPSIHNTKTVQDLVQGLKKYKEVKVESIESNRAASKETQHLTLDNTLAARSIGWMPKWEMEDTLRYTAEGYLSEKSMRAVMKNQIDAYTNF
jgi:CDP-glucose 4,6-dehydratase